jgi:predicted nucleic acid-binding protein
MTPTAKTSECGRFVRLDGLYLDKSVYATLMRWSQEHQLQPQDAIQLALCAFNERNRSRVLHVQDSAF